MTIPVSEAKSDIQGIPVRQASVIATNFKRRLSGVTSTVVQLVPAHLKLGLPITTLGPGLPPSFPHLQLRDLPALWRKPAGRPFRIWHARRNTEMLGGIVARDVLRMPLRLVFTSAAQRHHTAWTRFLISRMDAVIATSTKSARFLRGPATVILHGIDLSRFGPDGISTPEAAFPGRLVIGCSGRIRFSKGTDVFVDAMIRLLPSRPDWIAVATGRATAEHQSFLGDLKARVSAAGLSDRILFPGEVPDVAPWFRRFDLYVAPPRAEGFGLTPLEAMASGTPVVASDAGAFSDMIHEGETGRIVPVGDVEALAEAAATYMDDPVLRSTHGRAALTHVRTHFALEREAAEIMTVYEGLWARR